MRAALFAKLPDLSGGQPSVEVAPSAMGEGHAEERTV